MSFNIKVSEFVRYMPEHGKPEIVECGKCGSKEFSMGVDLTAKSKLVVNTSYLICVKCGEVVDMD